MHVYISTYRIRHRRPCLQLSPVLASNPNIVPASYLLSRLPAVEPLITTNTTTLTQQKRGRNDINVPNNVKKASNNKTLKRLGQISTSQRLAK